jgi:hypothetical protein
MGDRADDEKGDSATPPRELEAERPPGLVYLVFAQRADARIDIDGWNAHASRFFSTRLGLTEEKRYAADEPVPTKDRASFVVAPTGETPGIRSALARPRNLTDLTAATEADERAGPGGTGLALLARRCETVWIVSREAKPDPLALRLAAIFASVLLGPILDPDGAALFGAKTARAKLAALVSQS